jgi:hemerythrin superfamily protein
MRPAKAAAFFVEPFGLAELTGPVGQSDGCSRNPPTRQHRGAADAGFPTAPTLRLDFFSETTMNMLAPMLPTATNMIRLDHTHVMSTFHQYKASAPARVRKGLVLTMCTALEIHAQLEEEIFYPAMRDVLGSDAVSESISEHQEMKRLIALLRQMEPEAIDYDETVMSLMADVMHHVADEETKVLPAAERVLGDRLGEMGVAMTKRRLQLAGPRSGEIALNMGRAASGNTAALAIAAVAAAGFLLARHSRSPAGRHLQSS